MASTGYCKLSWKKKTIQIFVSSNERKFKKCIFFRFMVWETTNLSTPNDVKKVVGS